MGDIAFIPSGTAPVSSASGAAPVTSSTSTAPISSGVSPGTATPPGSPPGIQREASAQVKEDADKNLIWEEVETKTWTENAWRVTAEETRVPPNCSIKIQRQLMTVIRKSSRVCTYEVARTHNEKFWGAVSGGLFAVGVFLLGAAVIVGSGGTAAPAVAALVASGGVFIGGGSIAFKEGMESDRYKRGSVVSSTNWSPWVIVTATPVGAPLIRTTPIPCDRTITQPSRWEPLHESYDETPLSNTQPPPAEIEPHE